MTNILYHQRPDATIGQEQWVRCRKQIFIVLRVILYDVKAEVNAFFGDMKYSFPQRALSISEWVVYIVSRERESDWKTKHVNCHYFTDKYIIDACTC